MKTSFLKKIVVCALAGLLGLYAIHTDVAHRLPLPESLLTGLAFGFLLMALFYSFVWQYRESRNLSDSKSVLAFWQGVIIYCEALIFLRFDFLKLFGLHMNASLISGDFPAGALSGYHLMDYFFSRAPLFKIIIGCLQIAGGMAILWRKTRLLGLFILMPVVLNIVLMDIFYQVDMGITLVAIVLFTGQVYLLLQDKEKLVTLFFKTQSAMPQLGFKNKWYKHLLRLAAVAVTLAILLPSVKPVKNVGILGKYELTTLNINGQNIAPDRNNDSLPAEVYFDENETCLIKCNDYKRMKIGKAIYDNATGKLTVAWRYPKTKRDTSFWQLQKLGNGKTLALSGKTGKETLQATLVKTPLATIVIH